MEEVFLLLQQCQLLLKRLLLTQQELENILLQAVHSMRQFKVAARSRWQRKRQRQRQEHVSIRTYIAAAAVMLKSMETEEASVVADADQNFTCFFSSSSSCDGYYIDR